MDKLNLEGKFQVWKLMNEQIESLWNFPVNRDEEKLFIWDNHRETTNWVEP